MSVQEVYSKMPKTLLTPPLDERGGFALHFVDRDGKIVGDPLNIARINETPDDTFTVYYPKAGEPPEVTLRSLKNSNALIKIDTSDGPVAITKGEFRELHNILVDKKDNGRLSPLVSPAMLQRQLEQDTFQQRGAPKTSDPRHESLKTFLTYDTGDEDRHPIYQPPKPEEIQVSAPYRKPGKTSPKGTWINKVV